MLAGVRLRYIETKRLLVTLDIGGSHQNHLKSCFGPVQGYAAELTTGAMVRSHNQEEKWQKLFRCLWRTKQIANFFQ